MSNESKKDKSKKDLDSLGHHALHGLEDSVEILGHGVAGAVKGIADGVEAASAQTKAREDEADADRR